MADFVVVPDANDEGDFTGATFHSGAPPLSISGLTNGVAMRAYLLSSASAPFTPVADVVDPGPGTVSNQTANFGEYTAPGAGGFKPLDSNSAEVDIDDGTPTLVGGSLGGYTATITGNQLSFTGGGDGAPDGAVLRATLSAGGTVDITVNETSGEAHCSSAAELNIQAGKDSVTAAASGGKSGLNIKLRPGTYVQDGNAFNGDFVWHAGAGVTISSEVSANKARLQATSSTSSVLNIGASSVTGSTYGKLTLDGVEIYGSSPTFQEEFGDNFPSRYQEQDSFREFNVYLVELGIGNNPFRDVNVTNCDFIGNKTQRPWTATPSDPPVQYKNQINGFQCRCHDGQDITFHNNTFRYLDICGSITGDNWWFTNNHVQFIRADMLRMGTLSGETVKPTNINITGNLLDQHYTDHRFHPDWLQVFGGSFAIDDVTFMGNMMVINEQGVHCPPRDTSVNTGSAHSWAGPIDASGAVPAAEGSQFLLDLTGGDLALTLPDTSARPSGWTVSGAHTDSDDTIALTGGSGSFSVGDTVLIVAQGQSIGRHYEVMAWDGSTLTIAGQLQALAGGEVVDATVYHLNLQAFGPDGGNTATITAAAGDTLYDEDAAQTVVSVIIGNNGQDWDNVRCRMDVANNRWTVGRLNSGFTAYQGIYQFNQTATFDNHMYAYNIAVCPGQAIRGIQALADATNWDVANNTFVAPIIPDYIEDLGAAAASVQIDVASVTGPYSVKGNILGNTGSDNKFTAIENLYIAEQAGVGAAKPQVLFGGSGLAFNPGGTLSGSREDIINAVIADLRPTVETGHGALAVDPADDKWDFVLGVTKRDTPPLVLGLAAVAQVGGFALSWTAPGYQDDFAITGYDVDVRVDGGSWVSLATNQAGVTYSDAARAGGDVVEYRVRAVNSEGSGPNVETAALTVITPSLQGSSAKSQTSPTQTHDAIPTGTGVANDLVVMTIGARTSAASGVTLTGVTIGGEALDIVLQASTSHTISAIAAVRDTNGSIDGNSDVVLTFSSTALQSAIAVHRKSGISSSTAVDTDSDTAGGDLSLAGLDGAFVVASIEGWDSGSGGLPFTVTGINKDVEALGYDDGGDRSTNASCSSQNVSGDLVITANNDGLEVEVFTAAAFE